MANLQHLVDSVLRRRRENASKTTFLENMRNAPTSEDTCITCRDPDVQAVQTPPCGHPSCLSCMRDLLVANDINVCPLCRVLLYGPVPLSTAKYEAIDLSAIVVPPMEWEDHRNLAMLALAMFLIFENLRVWGLASIAAIYVGLCVFARTLGMLQVFLLKKLISALGLTLMDFEIMLTICWLTTGAYTVACSCLALRMLSYWS